MRKNYFAKKFVAYSMAFAVAFSTLTVSPVFVKEAKAATTSECAPGIIATADVSGASPAAKYGLADKTILVEKVTSSDEDVLKNTEITATDFLDKVGLGTTRTVRSIGIQTGATTIAKANLNATAGSVVDDSGLGTDSSSQTGTVKTASYGYTLSNIFGTGDVGGYANTNSYTIAYSLDGKTNKNVVLDFDRVAETTSPVASNKYVGWFKLTPHEGEFEVSKTVSATTTTKATVKYRYFTVDEVKSFEPTQTGNYDLGTLDESEFGYYICATAPNKNSSYNTVNAVYNIVEKSDLDVEARKATTYAVEGTDAKLTAVVSSSKPVTYKWYKGTVALENGNEATYTVKDLKDNTGAYKCEVTDGIDTQSVYPEVKLLTKTVLDSKTAGYNVINTYANVLIKDTTPSSTKAFLPNKSLTLTTSIPEGNYKYIWEYNSAKTPMSNSATLAYNASNRSNAIFDSSDAGNTDFAGATVTCYAVPTSAYDKNTTIANKIEKVNSSADDISKFENIKSLRDSELIFARGNYEFKEDITLQNSEAIDKSSVQVVKFGETVTLEAPILPGTDNAYTWEDRTDASKARIVSNKLVIDTLDQADLGTITCTIASCALDHNHGATGVASCNTGKTTKIKFNLLYVSDLTAEGSVISAKAGQKDVELKVSATCSLTPDYKWQVKKVDVNGVAQDEGTIAAAVNTNKTDSYKFSSIGYPADAFFTGDKKKDSVFYEVTVSDGFKTLPVLVKVNKIDTFAIYENEVDKKNLDEINYTTNATTPFKIVGKKGDKVTLAPIVVPASEDIAKELKYTWTKDGAEISSEPTLTVEYNSETPINYNLTVTEGTSPKTVKYQVAIVKEEDLKTVDASNIRVVDIESRMIYTGKELNPINKVVATVNGAKYTLIEGTDYTVELTDAINAGVSLYDINFIGNFVNAKVGVGEDILKNNMLMGTFTITRADSKLVLADKTVVLGSSVQPKTTTNLSKGALIYTYYADAACTTKIGVPTKVGTYYVKATSAATLNYNEAESNIAKVVVAPSTTKVTKVATNANAVKLTWSKVAGATAYRVYIKKNGKWAKVADTKSLTYTVKKLASATKYQFAVKAFAGSIASPKYVTKTAYTTPAKVATPAVKAGSRRATVAFKKVTRATGYQVYMAKGNGKYVKVATTAKLSVTKTGLTKGATYKFKVRAYKKVGSNVYYGAFSSAKAVKVK